MAHHPLVMDLVRLVGRLFYRDEYAVVLDALAREHALRDDGLEQYFGLPDRQVRRILTDLINEKLVCFKEITERRERKRDQVFDWAAAEAAMMASSMGSDREKTAKAAAAAANRQPQGKDSDSEEEEDDDDGEGSGDGDAGAGGAGAPGKRTVREKRKISTRLWYLNPRYFVDVVRYRLYLLKRTLERLEGYAGGSEHMFNCSNRYCTYECTLLEAQQRRTAEAHAVARGGGGGGAAASSAFSSSAIGSVHTPLFAGGGAAAAAAAGASAGLRPTAPGAPARGGPAPRPAAAGAGRPAPSAAFTCPLCASPLSARHTENVATAAAKVLVKLNDQARYTGLTELMRRLEGVRLGA
jgi:hypothetical protein